MIESIKMMRKTVTIQDEIYSNLNLDKYNSFSELVGIALKLLIEKEKEENYKKAMIEASKDKLYLEDMKKIENDFKFSDSELLK